MMTEVQRLMWERWAQYNADLEKACEAALQTGSHGVRVEWGESLSYDIYVDPSVPYGHIYETRPDA